MLSGCHQITQFCSFVIFKRERAKLLHCSPTALIKQTPPTIVTWKRELTNLKLVPSSTTWGIQGSYQFADRKELITSTIMNEDVTENSKRTLGRGGISCYSIVFENKAFEFPLLSSSQKNPIESNEFSSISVKRTLRFLPKWLDQI